MRLRSHSKKKMYQIALDELRRQVDQLNGQINERDAQIAALRRNALAPVREEISIDEECQMGRVPDLIKNLPQFTGNPKQVNGWLNSVHRILRIYQHLEGTELLELWLQEI